MKKNKKMTEGKQEGIHDTLGEDAGGWGIKDRVTLCAGFFPSQSKNFNATVAHFPNGTVLQSFHLYFPLQVHSLSSSVLSPFSADANPFLCCCNVI